MQQYIKKLSSVSGINCSRRFKNDTERLEKLFEMYTKMTAAAKTKPATEATRGKKA